MQAKNLKIFFFLTLTFALLSCNNETEGIPASKDNFGIASRGISLDEVKVFEADVKEGSLYSEMKSWKTALDKLDFSNVEKHQKSIDKTLNDLYDKYKKENVEEYVQILHEIEVEELGTHDGNPCTRNRNGTVYLGACTFWQKVSYFMNFSCSGLPKETNREIEAYMNCLQSIACRTCK